MLQLVLALELPGIGLGHCQGVFSSLKDLSLVNLIQSTPGEVSNFDQGPEPGCINQQPRQPWLGDQRNLGGPRGVTALRCIFKGGGQKDVIVSLNT